MAQLARKAIEKASAKRTPGRSRTLSKKDAAKKLAAMIEQHMSELGLSDKEKNIRVAKFSEHVDHAIASRAKP
jgi:hypothetical protein